MKLAIDRHSPLVEVTALRGILWELQEAIDRVMVYVEVSVG